MVQDSVAVVTYRGRAVENTHRAHIAVVGDSGQLLLSSGDAQRWTLPRSAAKPAQALAVLATGAMERFGFDEADLALVCGSHSSEQRHVERARAMLDKVAAKESDLQCGGHPPISEAVASDWLLRGFRPTPLCSNCSGKHVGMLAAARALGAPLEGYHLPGHLLQERVRHAVADLCDMPADAVQWAVDGCNLPTPAMPLAHLASLYAKLASAADLAPNLAANLAADVSLPDARHAALARIYRAMTTYPEWVAGEGRFCTLLMQAFGGALVGKTGADGCYGLGVRASDATRRLGVDGSIGIAVKVEDGHIGVAYMLVCEILERLQIGTAQERRPLASFHRPQMTNTMGLTTGHAEFVFDLRPA
ncbi:MAG: asparaginase [Comamonadaceae bacterium]|nr:MAG: asparaginase [Comamonadaceae bacterium]